MRKFAIVCLLTLAVPASAMALPLKPWLGVSGGINTYEMGDVSEIGGISLTNLDEIGNGFAFGVHGGIAISPMITVGAGYEFLTAGSATDDLSSALDFNLPAHSFRGGIELRAPTPGPVKLGAGASGGMVSSAGDFVLSAIGAEDVVGSVSGSGPMFEGYAVADLWFSPIMALSPSIGYRYAKISEIKVDGTTVQNLDGSDYSLDYSGYFMRLSLKISLP